jgi:hypothetical protein
MFLNTSGAKYFSSNDVFLYGVLIVVMLVLGILSITNEEIVVCDFE